MTQNRQDEQLILEKLRELPREKIQEVIDFMEFLANREQRTHWIEFDEWALNLAKERGFYHLTEDDVARIVDQHRQVHRGSS